MWRPETTQKTWRLLKSLMSRQNNKITAMKVTLSTDQAQKTGFFSGTTNSYKMNVQFKLNEKEKKSLMTILFFKK